MRTLICAALLLAAGSAMADLVASNDQGNELRLGYAACDHQEILDTIKPEYHGDFHKGVAILGGNVIKACWINIPEEKMVYVVYETGASMAYPINIFKEMGA